MNYTRHYKVLKNDGKLTVDNPIFNNCEMIFSVGDQQTIVEQVITTHTLIGIEEILIYISTTITVKSKSDNKGQVIG